MRPEIKAKREAEKKSKEQHISDQKDICEPDPRYATKEDFGKLMEAITDIAKTINKSKPEKVYQQAPPEFPGTADLSKVKDGTTAPTPVIPPTDEERAGGIEKIPVPPAWRKIVDELLGMDFGIDVVYPQSGSGFLFKIIVPAEKSNMSKDYKEFYKVDTRTRSLNYNEGIEGIRKFCEGVKKNLEKKVI